MRTSAYRGYEKGSFFADVFYGRPLSSYLNKTWTHDCTAQSMFCRMIVCTFMNAFWKMATTNTVAMNCIKFIWIVLYAMQWHCIKCSCVCAVLYLSIFIALLTAWAFQKRFRPQQLTLCQSLHAEALQATVSEELAQDPYMAARSGFKSTTLWSTGIESNIYINSQLKNVLLIHFNVEQRHFVQVELFHILGPCHFPLILKDFHVTGPGDDFLISLYHFFKVESCSCEAQRPID